MDSALIVSDFTRKLCAGLKAFSDPEPLSPLQQKHIPTRDDAADIKAFIRPLAGKRGASLGIKHARFERQDGDRRTIAEFSFDEEEINRAAINAEHVLDLPEIEQKGLDDEDEQSFSAEEVMLFFEQASRKPGKEKGKTGDRGVIPDVSDKAVAVYFRKSIQDLKEQMVKGDDNPLTNAFIVDVHIQRVGGDVKGYIVTNVHDVVPIDGGE